MGRASVHRKVTPATVRDKLRAECLHRVQEQRSALLWRLRNAHADGKSTQEVLESIIDDVVGGMDTSVDAASNAAHATSPGPLVEASPAADPQSISYGGTHSATTPSGWMPLTSGAVGHCISQEVRFQTPVHGFQRETSNGLETWSKWDERTHRDMLMGTELEYCPADDIELLLLMERALYEDVLQVQAEAAAADELAAVDAIIETHLRSTGPGSGSEPAQSAVPCPVCLHANLAERCGVIACPNGDLMLDLRAEGLSLEHLRGRLADAFASHAESGCGATPAFAPQAFERGGPATLLMSCAVCGALQVIV